MVSSVKTNTAHQARGAGRLKPGNTKPFQYNFVYENRKKIINFLRYDQIINHSQIFYVMPCFKNKYLDLRLELL